MHSSEDVLDALATSNGEVNEPPRLQQDLVAFMKTVYALVHTSRPQAINNLAVQVAGGLHRGGGDSVRVEVARVRGFWANEFSSLSPAGLKWRNLVLAAHMDTPDLAASAWGVQPSARDSTVSYDHVLELLKAGLEELVCPAAS